eukprot:TRINITY_DN9846_c1_g2_i2.p1 TRINITY_DN9846_c1_g2~~TRINITY_DN9846_c1_g2_i2.p1  ORF type:complete len:354 (+),score=43.53 TRINITY_DN9846_c1_g2_i2:51-1112(+)
MGGCIAGIKATTRPGRRSRRSRRDEDFEDSISDLDIDIQDYTIPGGHYQRRAAYQGGDGLFPFYLAVNSDGEDELFPWQPAVSSDGDHPIFREQAYFGAPAEPHPWQPAASPEGEQPMFLRGNNRLRRQDVADGDPHYSSAFSSDGLRERGSLFVRGYGIFPAGVIFPGLTGGALREFLDKRKEHDVKQKILSTAFPLPDEALLKMHSDSCIVCFEDFEVGSEMLRTPCDHYFCASCLGDWMMHQMRCPVCRASLDWPLDMAVAEVKAVHEPREQPQAGTARVSVKARRYPRRDYEKPWLVRSLATASRGGGSSRGVQRRRADAGYARGQRGATTATAARGSSAAASRGSALL